jgi:acetyl esterase/lipase
MATQTTDEIIGTGQQALPARIYRPGPGLGAAAPVVLHLHAGAFVSGSADAGRTVSELLADAGAVVVSPQYPLAPKNRFPRAVETLFHALTWLRTHRPKGASKKSGLFVAGEEAGGNLAAALALMARDQQEPELAGQILLSPMLDPCLGTSSVREANAGPSGCQWADGWHQYLGSADKAAHPYAAPVNSSRLSGVAPALIITAEDDLLRDESLRYARRLRESGVAVHDHVLSGPTHWPCSFANPDLDQSWTGKVRGLFKSFLADAMSPRRLALTHA